MNLFIAIYVYVKKNPGITGILSFPVEKTDYSSISFWT